MSVRFGVTAWRLEAPGPEALAVAARLGLDCVQVELGVPGREDYLPRALAAWRCAAGRSGVRITGVGAKVVNDLGLVEPEHSPEARRCRDVMDAAVDAAAQLGVGYVFFPSFRRSRIHDDIGLHRTAAALGRACRRAVAAGIQIGSENSLGAADNVRLLEAVREPNFRIAADTYNPGLFGHDVPELLRVLRPHLADQVHVKDGRDGVMGNVPLGEGDGRVGAALEALRAGGFAGALLLENDYRGAAGEDALRADLTRLRRVWLAAAAPAAAGGCA